MGEQRPLCVEATRCGEPAERVRTDHAVTGDDERERVARVRTPDGDRRGPELRRQLAEEGNTMLLVTHEMGFAREVSSHVMFLHQGRVEEEGPPERVFGNPDSERCRQFLASNF